MQQSRQIVLILGTLFSNVIVDHPCPWHTGNIRAKGSKYLGGADQGMQVEKSTIKRRRRECSVFQHVVVEILPRAVEELLRSQSLDLVYGSEDEGFSFGEYLDDRLLHTSGWTLLFECIKIKAVRELLKKQKRKKRCAVCSCDHA